MIGLYASKGATVYHGLLLHLPEGSLILRCRYIGPHIVLILLFGYRGEVIQIVESISHVLTRHPRPLLALGFFSYEL